jgi:hypothetical protein
MKNYPDFFQSVGKTLVQKANEGYILVDDNELDQLRLSHKIVMRPMPTAMGGRVLDVTQKPVWQFTE